jgi:copper chaperone
VSAQHTREGYFSIATTARRVYPVQVYDPGSETVADTTYAVTGMTCGHCVAAVTEEVTKVNGVDTVAVDLENGRVTVTGDGYADAEIAAAVDEAGYAVVTA